MKITVIFIYKFTDGTSFHLINSGLSIMEVCALEEVHGKLTDHGLYRAYGEELERI